MRGDDVTEDRFTAPVAGYYYFERMVKRQILAAFAVTAADIGLAEPSFLDARYHQRQKNRRKRR